MQPGEEKAFLKYGERVILASFGHRVYLANRGLAFQAGVVARSSRAETLSKVHLYPNLHEVVFELHPSLNYEALTEFGESAAHDAGRELLEKRMVLEANLNHAKIEENRGKFVKLGSVVQLFHPSSKTYLSFTTTKVAGTEMCAVGCSETTSESVQFTIGSPFDFLKEGSLISFDDKFLFTDAYNKTLAFPVGAAELAATRLKFEAKQQAGFFGIFGGAQERAFKVPAILESQKLFTGHCAGAVNEKSIGEHYANQFEAVSVEQAFDHGDLKESDLRWGDLVNIRKVDNSGKYSMLAAEVNKASLDGAVIYRTFCQEHASKMVNLESQFELVHVGMKARGGSISFDSFNSVKVMLKHVLSGKFLTVDPVSKLLVLGDDYEEALEGLRDARSQIEADYQAQYSQYVRLKEAKRFEEITKKDAPLLTQADIEFFQANGHELLQSAADYFKAYQLQRTFTLEKVSSDESVNLNNATFLKIRAHGHRTLAVVQGHQALAKLADARRKEDDEHFEGNFFDSLAGAVEQDAIVAGDACDIFHFEKHEQTLAKRFSRLNAHTAFLASVLCADELRQSTLLQYLAAVEQIEAALADELAKKALPKHAAQFLLVQMSTVDLLMDFLVGARKHAREADDQLRLMADACAATIRLLGLVCDQNTLACTYLFQWRKFFTVSIVKVDSAVFKQVNIDSLLFQVVDVLKCYSIYIDDYLSNLCASIKFEYLDIRKLTVLLQITKNFQNLRDPLSIDKVFEKIFHPAHKVDIFKKLEFEELDNNRVFFMAKDEPIELDERFKENEQIYRYFLQILHLVVSLAELDAGKTAKHLQDCFPKDICIFVFSEQQYPGELRAAFLRLFALLYIANLFQNDGLIAYEENITAGRARSDLRRSSETLQSLQTLKESDETRRFTASLLQNLTSSNGELALAALQTFNLLLGFKFFDAEFVLSIKTSLDALLAPQAGHNEQIRLTGQKQTALEVRDSRGPAFAVEDAATLAEVVDMLAKLHRSLVRNKVLQAIADDKRALQASSPSHARSAEEAAFDRVFGQEVAALDRRNADVWKVIAEWVKLKDSRLTAAVLQYVFESSLVKRHFLEKYTEFFQVESDEDSAIYVRVRAYLRSFSDQLRDLMSEYSTSDFGTVRRRSLAILAEYQALLDYFVIVLHANDRQTKFELAIKDAGRLRSLDAADLGGEAYLNLLNMFLLDCRAFKAKQTIMLKSGLLEVIMKTAVCFNSKVFASFARLEAEAVERTRFGLLPEFGGAGFGAELNTALSLLLYYALATNPENTAFVSRHYRSELQAFALAAVESANTVLKRVGLALLIEVYKNNVDELLRLRAADRAFFGRLLRQFQRELDARQHGLLLNYVELFAAVTQFNGALLEENAKDVFNCLFDENVQAGHTLATLIGAHVPAVLQGYSTLAALATKLDLSKAKSGLIFAAEQQDIDDMDERSNLFAVAELDDGLAFVCHALALVARFGKSCSADFKLKIQKQLSMNSVVDLAAGAKFNYYLKATLVDLLNSVYLTPKIDQNSKSYVLDLLSAIFSADLKDYFKAQTTSLTSKDVFFVNRAPRADCLVLETTRRSAAPCFTIIRQDTMFQTFAKDSVLTLLQKFLLVSLNDQNWKLVESIMGHTNDLVKAIEKSTRTVSLSLPIGAFAQSTVIGEDTRGKPQSTLFQMNLSEDNLALFVEDFKIKFKFLSKTFQETLVRDKIITTNEDRANMTRYFLKGYHRFEKPIKEEPTIFFNNLIQLMLIRDEAAEDVEVDYLDWRKAELEKEQFNNELLLVQKRSRNEKVISKSELRKKNKFAKVKSILFKQSTTSNLEKQKSSILGSPIKHPSNFSFSNDAKKETAKVINAKQLMIGKEIHSIDDRKSKSYHNVMKFKLFVQELISLLHVSDDSESISHILSYLKYTLESATLKAIVLEMVKEGNGTNSILRQVLSENPSLEALELLNELLKTDYRLQSELMDVFMQDYENKLLNRLMTLIEESCNSIVELEGLLHQFNVQSLEGAMNDQDYKAITLEMAIKQIHRFIELAKFPALLCRGHNLTMQNFLRYQKVNGYVRPFQMNIMGKLRDILRKVSKFMNERTLPAIKAILDLLTKLVQGPCKENQKEIILKKVTGVLEEVYSKLLQVSDENLEPMKCQVNLSFFKLKLGIVEGSSDKLVLKTLLLSFNPEFLISRLHQIYLYIYDESGYRQTLLNHSSSIGDIPLINEDGNNVRQSRTNNAVKRLLSNGDYSDPMKEALHIVMWMNTLADFDPEVNNRITEAVEEFSDDRKTVQRVMKYFKDHVRSIEIVDNDKNIQTVYFYLHPITKYLSRYSKERFEYDIDRKNWSTKLGAMVSGIDLLYVEMKHFANLRRFHIKANRSYLYYLKVINWCLSILLNCVLLFDGTISKSNIPNRSFADITSPAEGFVQFLGAIIAILYMIVFILWIAFDFFVRFEMFRRDALASLDQRIKKFEMISNKPISKARYFYFRMIYFSQVILSFLFSSNLLLVIGYIVVSILGLTTSKFYFSLLLLDIVDISPLIWSIIQSLTLNLLTLGATAVFGAILLFVYASFAFFSQYLITDLGIIDQPDTLFCHSLPMCFLNMASFGLKTGGGIGEKLVLPPNYSDQNRYVFRTIFDLIFWVTIIILLLNIILSIIIDSFAELRNQRQSIKQDIANVCFICGLSKEHFHRAEESFNLHTKRTHYMWNYIFFVVGLKTKPNEIQTGIESLIELKLLEKDLTWFPLKRTKKIMIEENEQEDNGALTNLETALDKLTEKFSKAN
jgi:hypothetical protein